MSKLPPELKRELAELETSIRRAKAVIDAAKNSKSSSRNGTVSHSTVETTTISTESPATAASQPSDDDKGRERISLTERKRALIEFLKERGPMRRNKIQEETRIPNGSLSSLLTEAEFVKDEKNQWMVKEN